MSSSDRAAERAIRTATEAKDFTALAAAERRGADLIAGALRSSGKSSNKRCHLNLSEGNQMQLVLQ